MPASRPRSATAIRCNAFATEAVYSLARYSVTVHAQRGRGIRLGAFSSDTIILRSPSFLRRDSAYVLGARIIFCEQWRSQKKYLFINLFFFLGGGYNPSIPGYATVYESVDVIREDLTSREEVGSTVSRKYNVYIFINACRYQSILLINILLVVIYIIYTF